MIAKKSIHSEQPKALHAMLVESNGRCQDRLGSCLLQLQKMPLWQLPLQSGEAAC